MCVRALKPRVFACSETQSVGEQIHTVQFPISASCLHAEDIHCQQHEMCISMAAMIARM